MQFSIVFFFICDTISGWMDVFNPTSSFTDFLYKNFVILQEYSSVVLTFLGLLFVKSFQNGPRTVDF